MKLTQKYLMELLGVAKKAALLAGAFLLKNSHSSKKVNSEYGKDIKIQDDVESEEIIVNYLTEKSDFSILSEEKGLIENRAKDLMWIVDPLDGSLNYLRSIPFSCVSIGLWKGEVPILGAVYDFNSLELFTGIVGKGAWLNGKAIAASTIDKKESAVLCTGFPVNTNFSPESLMDFIQKVREYKKIRFLGSAALSLVYVASGRVDAYLENDIMIWDVAAGLAIARSSGCMCDIEKGNKANLFHIGVTNSSFMTVKQEKFEI